VLVATAVIAAGILFGGVDSAILAEPAQFLEGPTWQRLHFFDPLPVQQIVVSLRGKS
jgi:hypothetical protein